MRNILALLQPIQNSVSRTTVRQLSHIILAMLSMTGRMTMLGLSRWSEKGGSYRTIQRFFDTTIPWSDLFWSFFKERLFDPQDRFLLAGDESIVTKAGKQTYGLDCFFSGLMKRAVPGLSFFTLALINTRQRRSYPIRVEQMIRTPEEKAVTLSKKQARKAKSEGPKRKPGRPKGSRNKDKTQAELNPELQRIQKMLQSFLNDIEGKLALTYLVLDGHFGNQPALQMVRQCKLHLISKLRHDAALYFPYAGPKPKRGPTARLGEKVDLSKISEDYLKETQVEAGVESRIYQMQLLTQEFLSPVNIVILLRINLANKTFSHAILFSSDLDLPYDLLVDFYSLRFQIEFNFRDAKQFWGLEDFMNVTQTAVTNAANLSLFMVDVSQVLLSDYRPFNPDFSILDLKAYFRGYRYVTKTIQMLPQKPDHNLVAQLFRKVATLGLIHPATQPVSTT